MRRAATNHMADRRAGMAQASSNAPIMVLGKTKVAIEIAKMLVEMPTKTKVAILIALNKLDHNLLQINTCPKLRAIKPCRNLLCLTLNRKIVTPTKATLAGRT